MRRPRPRYDRGASAIEYAGLIVLVAILLAAFLSGGLSSTVTRHVGSAVCEVFQGAHCGAAGRSSEPPSARDPNGRNPATASPPSRFVHGFFTGVRGIFGSHASLTPDPPKPARSIWPNGGGDQSSDHNTVTLDTRFMIQQEMGRYVDDGRVTVDCEPGGTTANCIPGAAKNGSGKDGHADIMLTGTDKATGKPVVYIWEVKSAGQRAEGPSQLARYVSNKRRQMGSGVGVRYGFPLPTRAGIPGRNRSLRAWSEPKNPAMRGIRLYGGEQRRKSRPQEQPQEQPGENPVTDCYGHKTVARLGCVQPVDPGEPIAPGGRVPVPGIRVPIPGIRIPLPPLVPAFP